MRDKDLLVERVSKKTNVKKEDIFKLANDLQKKDLNNEEDMRSFIQTVAKMTNQTLDRRKIDKLVKIMKNKDILNDVEGILEGRYDDLDEQDFFMIGSYSGKHQNGRDDAPWEK